MGSLAVSPGRRILIVEDEALVAMMVEDMIIDAGYVVADVASNLQKALTAVKREADTLDAAVLDVNLGGDKVFPVADALMERGIPFVFATGYGRDGIETRFATVPVLGKPYQSDMLRTALESVLVG